MNKSFRVICFASPASDHQETAHMAFILEYGGTFHRVLLKGDSLSDLNTTQLHGNDYTSFMHI